MDSRHVRVHSWITLRSTAEALDDEPPLRLDEIRTLVDELAGYALMDLQPMNGTYFRLARGVVTEHADDLLSPVIPTLEDAEAS
ncbi:Imm7 family immunity protein [Amycolatopsis sp. NPDC051758]|uniref:Imm7 family immunity protein n=1 Tax=Amycolatopsis sp. NPDC051758 TaxID=3363935 RepID=UPI0037B5E367